MANDQEVKYLVPGLERGLQLLLAFGEQHRDLTFAELHRLVDMPKATAYRVVQTLEYMGFLERNARTNTFSLGMNVLRLGFEYIASLDVAQVGQPVIEQLRDISQCSSHLAIRDGRDIIYIARVSAAGSRINQVSVGTRLPVHCTSLGRMLLTDVSRSEFEQLFPNERLPGNTPGQLYDREALWQMVQQDKARGYVIRSIATASHRLSIRSLTAAAGWRRSSAFWCRRTRSRKAIANGCRTTSVWRRTKFPASSDICHRQVKSKT